jgi:hypothetical protein
MQTLNIKEHMEVLGSDGKHVGTVDHLEGPSHIKLTKQDPNAGGQHHFIPVSWVERVDQRVYLKKTAQEAIGDPASVRAFGENPEALPRQNGANSHV